MRFSSFGILSHILGRDSRRVIIVHLHIVAQHGEKQQHYHEKQQEPLPHLIFTSPYKLMIIGYNECPRLASLASTCAASLPRRIGPPSIGRSELN